MLRSDARGFGGFSGLSVSEDRSRLLAVSDEGDWLSAAIDRVDGKPAGLSDVHLGAMTGPDGRPLDAKRDADAESLARLPDGSYAVGFERRHRIVRFKGDPTGGFTASALATPKAVSRLRANSGIETLATFPAGAARAGALLAIAEAPPDDGEVIPAWIIDGKRFETLNVARHEAFSVTDAAFLPDGDLILLERYYRPPIHLEMRLRRIAAHDIAPGATLRGTELLRAGLDREIDNMEALSVHRGADGRIMLTLMSDDNFNPFQRTLLLEFELRD